MDASRSKILVMAAILGIVLAGGVVLARPVSAITLIPPTLELGLTPGQPQHTVIKLFNESTDPVELYTEAQNFTAKGETGQPSFDFTEEPFGLSTWIDVEPGPIDLQPGERYEVPVTIDTPLDAEPGGHYAAVFFTTAPPEEGQVRVASKVGTLILANVGGADVVEQGSISLFDTADGQTVFTHLPIAFVGKFSNTGNVHLKPTGTLTVTSMFGKTADTFDFNAARGATLPDSTRRYEAVWERGVVTPLSGSAWSKFWQSYGNEKDNFALGRYTIRLDITAGTNESVSDTAEITLWILPWHVLLVWLVVLIIAVILIVVAIRKYNSWIITKAKGTQ